MRTSIDFSFFRCSRFQIRDLALLITIQVWYSGASYAVPSASDVNAPNVVLECIRPLERVRKFDKTVVVDVPCIHAFEKEGQTAGCSLYY